ncbi:MAG: DUF4037 domain-containing protein [Planctomycetales bacterium]|nr:DUF4037 domain-containing protein [Planctomycetales bacterium]
MAMTGIDVSRDFIAEALLPQLRDSLGDDVERLAIAIVGTGSDVIGLDDEISHDHHWGPRANVMYLRADAKRLGPAVTRVLTRRIPREFAGFEVHVGIGNLTGVCCTAVEDFFQRFLGTDRLPQRALDWLALCEVDLFHVTGGAVLHDGPGELTRRREALAYYPDNVWKKRIADWCMYVTGRDAPYNLHRVSKRGDELTCSIYFGLCLKRLMELCFAVNRQYAPYTKWLNRMFRTLPRGADALANCIDDAVAESSWRRRVDLLIEANYVIADALADLGLTEPVVRREFDDGLADLTLYDSAAQIYRTVPRELFGPSFNQTELWEKMAREVLFDANDYLQNSRDGNS